MSLLRVALWGIAFCCVPSAFSATVLSLESSSTAIGLPPCQALGVTAVSCTAISSVLGPGDQPTASIIASMNLTSGPNSFHLTGNASVTQNYQPVGVPAPPLETSLRMEALIDLPVDSGDWIVSGVNLQGENQQPRVNEPVQVNGTLITSADPRFPTTFTLMHEYGSQLQIDVVDNPLIYQVNSGEGLTFALDFTSASAMTTPEPTPGRYLAAVGAMLFLIKRKCVARAQTLA